MKLELEPNMYVRYISGFHHNEQNKPIVLIGKVLEITDNEMIKLDTFFGGGMFPIRSFEKLMKGEPSFEIIDLVQVGDYVNGYIVEGIQESYRGKIIDNGTRGYDEGGEYIIWKYNEDIKSIVTKEQFEAMAYKVVEE